MPGPALSLYWNLASLDKTERIDAAAQLVASINGGQITADSFSDADETCYCMKRLIKGLASSRKAARQGFTLALARILGQVRVQPGFFLDLLVKLTDLGTKKDEREVVLGRIFGIHAAVKAKILRGADAERATNLLLDAAAAKSYLREAAFSVLIDLLAEIKGSNSEKKTLDAVFARIDSMATPEDLWIVAFVSREFKTYKMPKSLVDGLKLPIQSPQNLKKMTPVLLETTHSHPRAHKIWATFVPAYSEKAPFEQFWKSFVEGTLMGGSNERKALGFNLLPLFVESLPEFLVPKLFTPKFCRTLINQCSKKENNVHECAIKCLADVVSICEKHPKKGLCVVLGLIGENGSPQFDQLTRTKTVEKLLAALDAESMVEYVKYLETRFSAQDIQIDEEQDQAVFAAKIAHYRQWSVDQMLALVRNNKLKKDPKWILEIVQFLAVYGFFEVDDGCADFEVPEIAIADATAEICRVRFYSVCSELAAHTRADEHGKLSSPGTMSETGEFWSFVINEKLEELLAREDIEFNDEFPEEFENSREQAVNLVSAIKKRIEEDDAAAPQLRAYEHLVLMIMLLSFSEPEECVDMISDLVKCYEKLFSKAKKRKQGEEHEPIEVLVDLILGLLSRPSTFLKSVSETVFRAFCGSMTKGAIELVLNVLNTRIGPNANEEDEDDEDDEEIQDDLMHVEGEDEEESEESGDSESAEDDEDEESEDDDEEVDPELKFTLEKALIAAGAAVGSDDEESDEGVDDETMLRFDEKYSEMMRERKNAKKEKRDATQQVLSFKLRALDLVEIFFKKDPQNSLIVTTILPQFLALIKTLLKHESTISKPFADKITSIFRNKLCKLQKVPRVENVDEIIEIMKSVHTSAKSAPSGNFVGMCASASVLLIKTAQANSNEKSAPIAEPEKKKRKSTKKKEEKRPESVETQIINIYVETLEDLITKKHTKLTNHIFTELLNRGLFDIAWPVITLTAEKHGEFSRVGKPFQFVQVFELAAALVNKVPTKEDATTKDRLQVLTDSLVKNLQQFFKDQTKEDLTAARFKEVLKSLMAILRKLRKFGGLERYVTFSNALEKRVSELEASNPGVQTMSQQLIKLLREK